MAKSRQKLELSRFTVEVIGLLTIGGATGGWRAPTLFRLIGSALRVKLRGCSPAARVTHRHAATETDKIAAMGYTAGKDKGDPQRGEALFKGQLAADGS